MAVCFFQASFEQTKCVVFGDTALATLPPLASIHFLRAGRERVGPKSPVRAMRQAVRGSFIVGVRLRMLKRRGV